MLSGEYNLLVDNMWLTDIIAVILLLIPLFLLFFNSKWIFTYYIVSIVSNLPLLFQMTFNFSYELIIVIVVIIVLIKKLYQSKHLEYTYTLTTNKLIVSLLIVLALNIITAFVHFNFDAVLLRIIIYTVNIFILAIYLYYINEVEKLKILKNGFLIGGFILVVSIILELVYDFYYLGERNLRPAGLLLDPNVAGFALNLCLIISFYKFKNEKPVYELFVIILRVLLVFAVFLTVSRSSYIGTTFILIAMIVHYSRPRYKFLSLTVVIVFVLMYVIFNKTVSQFIKNIFQIIDLDRIFEPGVETPTDIPGNPSGGGEGVVLDSRITLLIAGIKVFYKNFLTGVGIGNVPNAIYLESNYQTNTHNLMIQLVNESGFLMIFALLILGYYLVKIINTIRKNKKNVYDPFFLILILIIFLIESVFNHNLLNINIVYLVLVFYLKLAIFNSKEKIVIEKNLIRT